MLLKGLDKAIQELLPNARQIMSPRHVLANRSINLKALKEHTIFGDVPKLHINKN